MHTGPFQVLAISCQPLHHADAASISGQSIWVWTKWHCWTLFFPPYFICAPVRVISPVLHTHLFVTNAV